MERRLGDRIWGLHMESAGMSDAKYTPDELRAQVPKMHPAGYEGGTANSSWLLNVGICAGMLSVAADRIEALETELAALREKQAGIKTWGEMFDWMEERNGRVQALEAALTNACTCLEL